MLVLAGVGTVTHANDSCRRWTGGRLARLRGWEREGFRLTLAYLTQMGDIPCRQKNVAVI